MCDVSTVIQPVIRTLLAELLCQHHFTWLSEAGMVKKSPVSLHEEHTCSFCSAVGTMVVEIFPFPLQDKITVIKVEVFEKHSLSLPNAVTIFSKGNMNQKKEVKSSYNSIASL